MTTFFPTYPPVFVGILKLKLMNRSPSQSWANVDYDPNADQNRPSRHDKGGLCSRKSGDPSGGLSNFFFLKKNESVVLLLELHTEFNY